MVLSMIHNNHKRADSQTEGSVKTKLDVKLINVPPIPGEIVAESIRDLSNKMLGKQIILFGTVLRTGNVNSRELYKNYACK